MCLGRDNQGVNIQDTRRANLAAWIKKTHDGNVTAFARATKLHQPRLADILAKRKPFGEKYARKVEDAAKMSPKHLDGLSGEAKAGLAAYHGIFLTRAGALLGAEWEKLDLDQRIDFEQKIYAAAAKKIRGQRKPRPEQPSESDDE
jgi:hypothetical protein